MRDLLNKNNHTVEEMIVVVQAHIKETKGQKVRIDPLFYLDPASPMFPLRYQNQVRKLSEAFEVARAYFLRK